MATQDPPSASFDDVLMKPTTTMTATLLESFEDVTDSSDITITADHNWKESINTHSTLDKKFMDVSDLSSSLRHFGWVDYLVFVLMLIVCAVIGVYFGFIEKRKKKNRRSNNQKRRGSEALDYLVGGRQMKVIPVSLSLVAR